MIRGVSYENAGLVGEVVVAVVGEVVISLFGEANPDPLFA